MSRPFITTCSHCGHEITIPYEGLPHHFHQQLGRLSAAKRADRKKHLSAMNRQRWHTYAYPKQEALLAVAKTVDIDTLPMTQIADRLGYVGRYRGGYVKRLIRHLQKKGLLPEKR